jgi:hypothetical protein
LEKEKYPLPMKNLNCLAALPIALCAVAIATPAFAITSPDGSLTIMWQSGGCKTGEISGTYNTKSDVSGVLYEFDCGKDGDVGTHFFIDTQGSERCYGKMINSWGGRGGESTRWEVLGAVPSYKCSSVGQTLKQDGMR